MNELLLSLGLNERDDLSGARGRDVGRVVIMHGDGADVLWRGTDGEVSVRCALMPKLHVVPVAGDWVVVQDDRIVEVLTRRNELRRPRASGRGVQVLGSNIDLVIIAVALNREINERILERLALMASDSGASTVVVATKNDQAVTDESWRSVVQRHVPESEVLVTSARTGEGIDELRAMIGPGVTAVLLGPSGVGRTSLLNALDGRGEPTRVTQRSGEGRHATSTRRLYRLSSGGVLLDIPGIRLLNVVIDDARREDHFADVEELALSCRFRNCSHGTDVGCAVREAVDDGDLAVERLEAWRRAQMPT